MGREICVCLSSSSMLQQRRCAHILSGVAKAARRSCELANPAQVRQIASQTGVLLCRMRFVAGRGAEAELLQAGDRRHRGLPAGALQRRAIGKMLPAGSAAEDRGKRARQLAPARKATCRKGAPSGSRQGKSPRCKQGKSHPVLGKQKRER